MTVFLALLPPAELLLLAIKARSRLSSALFWLTFVHESLLVALPTIYSVMTGYELENDLNIIVGPSDILNVLVGENIFTGVLLSSFWLARSMDRIAKRKGTAIADRSVCVFLDFLVLCGWLVYVPQVLSSSFGGDITPDGGIPLLSQLLGWMSALFWLPSLVACGLVVSRPYVFRHELKRALFAAVPLLAIALIGLTMGLKGRFTWVISVVAVGGFLQRNRFFLRAAIVGTLLVVPFFPFLGSEFRRTMYQVGVLQGAGPGELLSLSARWAMQSITDSSGSKMIHEIIGHLAERAQGPRNSVVLYRQYDERKVLDLRDLTGAILFPIPRLMYPGKPMFGSPTSSEFDSAIYLVMSVAHNKEGYMGPILASSSAYWEGGWLWVALCGFVTGIFWAGIVGIAQRLPFAIGSLLVLVLAGSLLIDGLFTIMLPLFSLITQCWKMLLLAAIMIAIDVARKLMKSGRLGMDRLNQQARIRGVAYENENRSSKSV